MSENSYANYGKLFEEAEKSVSNIKNEKLKEIAFEKLITHLLSDNQGQENSALSEDSNTSRPVAKAQKKNNSRDQKQKSEGPKAWLTELVEEGFFQKPKSATEIIEEFKTRSHHLKASDLTSPLQALCHEKLLRRKQMAPPNGGRAVYHWSKW